MKKTLLTMVVFAFTLSSCFGFSDFELKNEFEKTFERKLSILYPDNKFMVNVALNAEAKIESNLFGSIEVQSNQSFSIKRIKKVNIATDSDLTADVYAGLLEIPQTKITIQKSASYQKPISEEKPPKELKDPKDKKDKNQDKSPISPLEKGLIALFGVLVCGLIFWGVTALRKLSETIFQASQKTKSEESNIEPVNRKNNSTSSEGNFSNHSADNSFVPRKDQLKAIFSDLYWSHEDAKAAALVMKYQEVSAYKELSFGEDYLKYLRSVSPQKCNFWEDSYYVSPNESLSEISLEDMQVEDYLVCSQFRLQHCPFSSVTLASSVLKKQATSARSFKASSHRVFAPPVVVSFKSVKDEEEFFSSNLPENVKFQVSSLCLLQFCEESVFVSLVDAMNVNELANIWVGPEAALTSLMERIPERKKNLLKDVLESRNNLSADQYIAIRSSSAYLEFTNLIKSKIEWKQLDEPIENSLKAVG